MHGSFFKWSLLYFLKFLHAKMVHNEDRFLIEKIIFRYSKMAKIDADRESTTYNFISSALSLIFVPLFGFFADKFCWHSNFAVIAPLVTQISFFLYISFHPLIPTIIFSLGYSLNYTAVWSNISLCVNNKQMVILMNLY